MTQTIEAIYTGGVFKPTTELPLRDNQRVRLTVETVDETNMDREVAVTRLKAGIASMRFFSEGPLSSMIAGDTSILVYAGSRFIDSTSPLPELSSEQVTFRS
jgi:predicted DNA-binding antitoxin AbrB/MazE fold protein